MIKKIKENGKNIVPKKHDSNGGRFIFFIVCFIFFSIFKGLNDFMENSSVIQNVTVESDGKIKDNIGLSENKKGDSVPVLELYSKGLDDINSDQWKTALDDFKKYKNSGGQSIYVDYFIGYCIRRPLRRGLFPQGTKFIEAFNEFDKFLKNSNVGSSQFRIYAGTEIMNLTAESHDLKKKESALNYLDILKKELPAKNIQDEKKFAEAGYFLIFRTAQQMQSENIEGVLDLYDRLLEPIGIVNKTDDPTILKNYFFIYRKSIINSLEKNDTKKAIFLWNKLYKNFGYLNEINDRKEEKKQFDLKKKMKKIVG